MQNMNVFLMKHDNVPQFSKTDTPNEELTNNMIYHNQQKTICA